METLDEMDNREEKVKVVISVCLDYQEQKVNEDWMEFLVKEAMMVDLVKKVKWEILV